jgi:hypothetical protein
MNLIVIRVQSCAGRKELRTARYDIPSPIDLPESLILSIICPSRTDKECDLCL